MARRWSQQVVAWNDGRTAGIVPEGNEDRREVTERRRAAAKQVASAPQVEEPDVVAEIRRASLGSQSYGQPLRIIEISLAEKQTRRGKAKGVVKRQARVQIYIASSRTSRCHRGQSARRSENRTLDTQLGKLSRNA
jgi:hypothetical protein